MKFLVLFYCFVGNLLLCLYCAPTIPTVETFDFLRKFGYIPDDGDNSAALFTEDGLEIVIKEMQKFGAIEQTGKLDNETLALMKRPRCGVPDVFRHKSNGSRAKRFVLGPKGWNKRSITFFIANWSGKLSEEIVDKYITLGLETWGRYANLKFKRVYSPEADIIVAFGRGYHGDSYPFDGPGNVLAHAFFPYEFQHLGGDIHFDDDEAWTEDEDPSKGTNFFQVAIHELGHSLGLSHSPVRSSVMFAYYTGAGPQQLDYDDILGMYELYIKRRLESDWSTMSPTWPSTELESTSLPSVPSTPETTQDPYWKTSSTSSEFSYNTRSPRLSTISQSTISYYGDSETVDVHKTHDPTHHIPPSQPAKPRPRQTKPSYHTHSPFSLGTTTLPSRTTLSPKRPSSLRPDICEGNYDAVAALRGELFVFKGQYLWRLRQEYDLVPGYPVLFRQMFPMLPETITRIDAAYQRPDGQILLFSGKQYWVFDGTKFDRESPFALTNLGLDGNMERVDAVQNWGRNGKTYFYRGNMFWRYDEEKKVMDDGYPMKMDRWRGVPGNLDAATTWKGQETNMSFYMNNKNVFIPKGTTYFFKSRCHWKFDNDWIITTRTSPLPTPQTWFNCPKEEEEYCVPPSNRYPWE